MKFFQKKDAKVMAVTDSNGNTGINSVMIRQASL